MASLKLESTPTFVQSDIQGELIPEVPVGFPFTSEFLDSLSEACPVLVGIDNENLPENPDGNNRGRYITGKLGDSAIGLRRLGRNHGRSYEIFVGEPESSKNALAFWSDEFGNQFTSLSTKGNNFSSPRVYESATAPSGYIPHGLLETDALLRVIRASRIMREEEIDTEMIVRVLEPKYFRYPKTGSSEEDGVVEADYVTLPEFKRRLLIDHWDKIAEQPDAAEEFKKVSVAIQKTSFFVTIRAMGIGTRMHDIIYGRSEDQKDELSKIFKIINIDSADVEGFVPMSVDNHEDIVSYYHSILPSLVGYNLGKLHKKGLAHTFPVFGNITTLGGLIDLDSVRGEPLGLGDPVMTELDFAKDRQYHMLNAEYDDFIEIFLLSIGPWQRSGDEYGHYKLADGLHEYEQSFLKRYVEARYDNDIDQCSPEEFLEICENVRSIVGHTLRLPPVIEEIVFEQVDIDELPELLEIAEIEEVLDMVDEWVSKNAETLYMEDIMANLSKTQLTNTLSHYAATQHASKSVGRRLNMYIFDLLQDKYIESEETNKNLTQWVEAHKKPDSEFSDDILLKVVAMLVRENTAANILGQLQPKMSMKLTDMNAETNLYLESIVEPSDDTKDLGCFRFMVKKNLVLVHDRITAEDLLMNIVKKGEPPAVTFEAKGLNFDRTDDFIIDSNLNQRVREIFTDGHIEAVISDEYVDPKYTNSAQIRLPAQSIDKFVAWTTYNESTRLTTLHLRLSEGVTEDQVIRALNERGYINAEEEAS